MTAPSNVRLCKGMRCGRLASPGLPWCVDCLGSRERSETDHHRWLRGGWEVWTRLPDLRLPYVWGALLQELCEASSGPSEEHPEYLFARLDLLIKAYVEEAAAHETTSSQCVSSSRSASAVGRNALYLARALAHREAAEIANGCAAKCRRLRIEIETRLRLAEPIEVGRVDPASIEVLDAISPEAIEAKLAAWAGEPIGRKVYVTRDTGSVQVTQTRSNPWKLPSGEVVIQLVGLPGCFAFRRVRLVEEEGGGT